MIAEFDIKPDGRLIYSFYLQQSNYGCTTRLKTAKTGRASTEGSHVTFIYDESTTTSEDNCHAKYNYTKTVPASRETFDFPDSNGFRGHSLRPPMEAAISKLCSQFA